MSRDQNAGRSHSRKNNNSSFEMVEEFKFLGQPQQIKILFRKIITAHCSQGMLLKNLLPSSLLSKNIKIKIQRTVILSIVLYGCENWSLTLKEENMLRVFQNKVLRRIFGSKRDEVTEEWRELYNEELNDLYSSPNTLWVIKLRIISGVWL